MKKFAISYSTVSHLLQNAEVRNVSDDVRLAYEKISTEIKGESCTPCAKRKRANEATIELISKLQSASDMEIDRLKKVLGVDKLVFGSGLTFIER